MGTRSACPPHKCQPSLPAAPFAFTPEVERAVGELDRVVRILLSLLHLQQAVSYTHLTLPTILLV
eukprot:3076056-Pyramimonas_sp.AAC.1